MQKNIASISENSALIGAVVYRIPEEGGATMVDIVTADNWAELDFVNEDPCTIRVNTLWDFTR